MHAAIEPAFATRYARCVAKASTSKKAIYLATEAIQRALGDELRRTKSGLAHVSVAGESSCALSVNEAADASVRSDMLRAVGAVAPDADVATALVGKTLSVPVLDGKLALGTWQGVYLFEMAEGGGEREMTITLCDYGDARKTARRVAVAAPGRGCHLITGRVPKVEAAPKAGVATFFCQHTSASLTINENCDPDVRVDLAAALDRIVPEAWHHEGFFEHVDEGPDDMTAHVKTSLVGSTMRVPVVNGNLRMGTWQGAYLNEHRNVGGFGRGHSRDVLCVCDENDAMAQTSVSVSAGKRGLRDITDDVIAALRPTLDACRVGLVHCFCEHTSASVVVAKRGAEFEEKFERALNAIVPESWNDEFFRHTAEGPDDMPGHVKSTLVGASVTLPVADGALVIGDDHRLYLCEHRTVGGFNSGLTRRITLTLQGTGDEDATILKV